MPTLLPISPDLAATFKSVRLRALQDTPTAFGSTYAKEVELTDADWIHRAIEWNSTERSAGLLAMDESTPCGIACAFLNPDDPSIAHLVSTWVAPTHRHQGIGRQLVEPHLAWATARAARKMKLMVTCNNTSAIRFYDRLGFIRTGRVEPYPNDPALVEYEMSRPL
jgi:ribosomal protein S18 acetylase RimI-like enzyme